MQLIACHPVVASSPTQVMQKYSEYLESGRFQQAYALLSLDAKKNISRREFSALAERQPQEVAALAESLRNPNSEVDIEASVTTQSGEEIPMVYEDGRWKLRAGAVDLYSQATPLSALRSFIRCYEFQRYERMMLLVPNSVRADLTADMLRLTWNGPEKKQMDVLVRQLKEELSRGIVEDLGDRAVLRYGASQMVELIFEDGLWKIEDFR